MSERADWLTGAMLGRLLDLAADNVGGRASDADMARAVDIQELLYQAAEMARSHSDAPVDIDITIGPSFPEATRDAGGE